MRKVLLSAVALMGIAVTTQFAGAGPAMAQPAYAPYSAYGQGHGPGLVQSAQYRGNHWREQERRREWLRHRRHEEWRGRPGYHGYRGF